MSDPRTPRSDADPGGEGPPVAEGVGVDRTTAAGPELIVLAGVAILVGVVTRFVTRSALWLDEALSVDIARLPIADIPEALKHDGHPPLYYVLLHGWTALFGDGAIAVRAMSGVFGLLTLVLLWFVGRRRGGPVLAWILVTIVAVSPFAVRYSDEARMYALVMLLVVVGWFLLDDIVVRGRRTMSRFAGLALVAAALLYSHYWSMWLLAAVGLCALWGIWRRPTARRSWVGVLGAVVVGGLLFVPWVPTMLYQAAHTGTPWATAMRPTSAVSTTIADYSGGNYGEQAMVAVLLGLAIVLGLFGAATGTRTVELDVRTRPQVRREAVVAALTIAIGTSIGFVSRSAYSSRYSSVVFPLVMVVAAAGLTRFAARWVRFGAVLALAAALSIGAFWNITWERTQSRPIGAAISAGAAAGDLVVVCPDQLGPSITRVVPDSVRVLSFPDGGDGRFVDWVDYADRNAASDPSAFARTVLAEASDRTIWLVWSTSYRTIETQCAALAGALSQSRPSVTLVADDGANYYEHATLTRFAVPS